MNIINVFSIIGTLVGIAGLVISILTLVKTSSLESAIKKRQVTQDFKSKFKVLYGSITTTIEILYSGDRSPRVINNIFNEVKNLKIYSDNGGWEKSEKRIIENCHSFIDKNYKALIKVQENNTEEDDLIIELIKQLSDLLIILKKEGLYHDIRSN